MAKESKNQKVNPYVLAVISAVLLTAALLMKSFPVLIFVAIAPLFAITDHTNENNFWNKIELIAAAFAVALVAWSQLDESLVMTVVLEPIVLALVFLAFTYSKRGLGSRLGMLTLILFWLAMEYLKAKFFVNKPVFYLASVLDLKPGWLRWTKSTGYLGASLWILMANWFVYLGLFRNGLRISYLLVFLVVILGPIFYSYTLQTDYAMHARMYQLYMGHPSTQADGYSERGEWIARTAAWISVLIFLSAFVKDNIRKK